MNDIEKLLMRLQEGKEDLESIIVLARTKNGQIQPHYVNVNAEWAAYALERTKLSIIQITEQQGAENA